MKKLITLFIIALITLTSIGQNLDNKLYFRFGYSNPSWSQFGLTEQDWNSEGIDSKTGASFELGNIFMLNSILNTENMAFGINVDYLYANYNNFSGDKISTVNIGTARLGSKIGPSFTYSPVDKLAFDIYAKADFAWATASVIYEDEIGNADDYYTNYVTVGFSSGINIRYGLLILGIEYNTISPELESDDYPGEYLQNGIDEIMEKSSSGNKSEYSCFNFTLGMSF